MCDDCTVRPGPPATISVTRTVKVRVEGVLTDDSARALERILHDLIVDQGVSDVVVDLSQAMSIGEQVSRVLERAESQLTSSDGRLELRVPVDPPRPLVEATSEIPKFVPLEAASDQRDPDRAHGER
jgi:anti-anti-sigma regulatory factor